MSDGFESLYPFLDTRPGDPAPVLADVRRSTLQKARDIRRLRDAVWASHSSELARAARILAGALARGGTVLAFGNGGSSTDAMDLVADLVEPVDPERTPFPALDLTRDAGVVTAVGNDVGFESVFVRQLIAHGREGDVAVGFSTSGESENVLRAFERAKSMGMATVGFSGQSGGSMARDGFLDAVIVAPSDHVPRIQEAHATAYHAVLAMTRRLLGGDGAPPPDLSSEIGTPGTRPTAGAEAAADPPSPTREERP